METALNPSVDLVWYHVHAACVGYVLIMSVDEKVLKLQEVKLCVHQSSSKHFSVALGTVALLAILFS